jgi:hypothetical protein
MEAGVIPLGGLNQGGRLEFVQSLALIMAPAHTLEPLRTAAHPGRRRGAGRAYAHPQRGDADLVAVRRLRHRQLGARLQPRPQVVRHSRSVRHAHHVHLHRTGRPPSPPGAERQRRPCNSHLTLTLRLSAAGLPAGWQRVRPSRVPRTSSTYSSAESRPVMRRYRRTASASANERGSHCTLGASTGLTSRLRHARSRPSADPARRPPGRRPGRSAHGQRRRPPPHSMALERARPAAPRGAAPAGAAPNRCNQLLQAPGAALPGRGRQVRVAGHQLDRPVLPRRAQRPARSPGASASMKAAVPRTRAPGFGTAGTAATPGTHPTYNASAAGRTHAGARAASTRQQDAARRGPRRPGRPGRRTSMYACSTRRRAARSCATRLRRSANRCCRNTSSSASILRARAGLCTSAALVQARRSFRSAAAAARGPAGRAAAVPAPAGTQAGPGKGAAARSGGPGGAGGGRALGQRLAPGPAGLLQRPLQHADDQRARDGALDDQLLVGCTRRAHRQPRPHDRAGTAGRPHMPDARRHAPRPRRRAPRYTPSHGRVSIRV